MSEEEFVRAVETIKKYNPRIHYHEEDYTPEEIFRDMMGGRLREEDLLRFVELFFEKMELKSVIYPDSIRFLWELKSCGARIAAFTDVAVGMPDWMHREYCKELLPCFDLYVSSASCGF